MTQLWVHLISCGCVWWLDGPPVSGKAILRLSLWRGAGDLPILVRPADSTLALCPGTDAISMSTSQPPFQLQGCQWYPRVRFTSMILNGTIPTRNLETVVRMNFNYISTLEWSVYFKLHTMRLIKLTDVGISIKCLQFLADKKKMINSRDQFIQQEHNRYIKFSQRDRVITSYAEGCSQELFLDH